MSAVPAQLLVALLMPSVPPVVKSTAVIVTLDVPVSFSVTVRFALFGCRAG